MIDMHVSNIIEKLVITHSYFYKVSSFRYFNLNRTSNTNHTVTVHFISLDDRLNPKKTLPNIYIPKFPNFPKKPSHPRRGNKVISMHDPLISPRSVSLTLGTPGCRA